MPFRDWSEPVLKEDLPIPKHERWYQQLTPTPNRVFGENVLVAARMSDQWSPDSKEVPVLKIGDQEAQLYQAAFATFGGSMGVHPLRDDEERWYEHIRGNFMYPVADAFASPPTATEGAQIPKPRPLRSMTSAGKEVVYLSSEESVGSSNGELSPWSNIFAGVLRDLGIDPEDKKKKPLKKKNLNPEVTSKGAGSSRATAGAAGKGTLRLRQSDLKDYVIISDSREGLSRAAEKKTGAGGSKSSGSAGSRNPDADHNWCGFCIGSWRDSLIGKTSNLRSLYKFSPGKFLLFLPLLLSFPNHLVPAETKKTTPEKGVKFTEPEPKRPKITIESSKIVGAGSAKEKNVAEVDKARAAKEKAAEEKRRVEERRKKVEEERKRKIEEDKKTEEAKRKKAADMEKEKKKTAEKGNDDQEFVITMGPVKPHQESRKEPEVEKPTHPAHTRVLDRTKVTSTRGPGRYVSSGASSGGAGGYNPQVIGAKDTLGDIYYKSYTEEERGNAPHQAPWGLKQRDTFHEFGPCRDWFLNSFTPGEVNRQRAKNHESLYRTYVIGEANTRAANHQIVREWRTMVRERADWESYHERMLKCISEFEKSKASFDEEKAKFDADKKAEEWGREGLKNKLQAAEQQLAKEKAEFKPYVRKTMNARLRPVTRLSILKPRLWSLQRRLRTRKLHGLLKSRLRFVELADVKLQLSNKDKDLRAKDVEIAELKRRLNDQVDKCESLEIDLAAEKVKAGTAEEARDVSTAALNVAQTNYSEAQGIVDTLVSEAEWMRNRGVVLVANSVLNAGELDRAVTALTDVARAVGHRGGYLECAQHVEEVFGQEFDVSHCSVTNQASAELTRAEDAYDNLSLPVMDFVAKALEHDDWCHRLKAILDPPITVELSDEEPAGDDDGNDGDDGGNDDDDGGNDGDDGGNDGDDGDEGDQRDGSDELE
ncbi:hypothetical protein HanXRQr2_Chr06g0251781 [Helianthus annuus]|uniref:Uncharacterized protein n=1 Tax=Helianthus annuus TaxID=4232 RepID=A0A9K3IRK4_HELAN|nr:hypothetical protein HanXRQr2_Chr06g0251781 [Helianthus annuus]KAJ0572999.1 hypothetical protein HanHA89_Chr06g0221931 [Helianthus annuus]